MTLSMEKIPTLNISSICTSNLKGRTLCLSDFQQGEGGWLAKVLYLFHSAFVYNVTFYFSYTTDIYKLTHFSLNFWIINVPSGIHLNI